MQKHLFIFLFTVLLYSVNNAQTVATFESLTVPDGGYYNGSTDHSGTINTTSLFTYTDNDAEFNITYTLADGYDFWSGFAYSNQEDQTTTGYTNYSAVANPTGGSNNSSNYGFSYGVDSVMFGSLVDVQSVYITNSVYAYLYMQGQGGGYEYQSGDYFILKIKGIKENGTYTDEVIDFYLADFTNGNSYIVNNWTNVDLSSLGNVAGLKFTFESTDVGTWGINTPLYFCMDDLSYNTLSKVNDDVAAQIKVYPNPVNNIVNISGFKNSTIKIFDVAGKILVNKSYKTGSCKIDFTNYTPGIYFINIINNKNTIVKKIIKR